MAGQNTVELIVDGSGALRVFGQVEAAADKAGAAVDGLNASGKQTGQAFNTGAVDRFTAAMAKMEDATRRGAAITTESVARKSAEQKALERWQSRESEQMALQIRLRREAERAAVDMANAVRLGYTTQESALQSLVNLERQHATQIQALTDVQQNAAKATATAATANNTLAGSLNRVAAANDNARFASANVAAQFQDVAVTAAMGMNPLMIALQQGTQLSSVLATMQSPLRGLAAAFGAMLNPTSLLTIGFVALGAAAIQWFMGAEEEADKASTALERHRKWIDALLAGYDDLAKAAREAGEAARALPQGVVDLELGRGLATLALESDRLNVSISQTRELVSQIMDDLSVTSAPMAFSVDRDQLDGIRAQLESLRDIVLTAGSSRQQLEAAAVAAGRLFDSSDNDQVREAAKSIYDLTLQVIDLTARTKEAEAAQAMLSYEIYERRNGKGVSDAIDRVTKQMVDLRSEKQRLDDAFRSDAMGARTLSEVYALADAYEALNKSIAARDAQKQAEGLAGALEDLNRRAREVTLDSLAPRQAATLRIVDEYKAAEAELRKFGASEADIARNTAVMNEAIRQSSAHFDEIDRKAGEKGAAKAVKELNREMESFLSRADGLLEKAFPGEAARREAEELLRLLDLYGSKLDDVQRAAVEARIGDQFQAAALGVRELERDTATSGDNIKGLLGDIGNIAAGIFDGAKDSVWDWVDAIVAAIGQIGQRLMAFGSEVKQADPVAGLAASAASAARSVPANYVGPNYTGTAPAIGARGARGIGEIASAVTATADLVRYTNQGATRNLHLSQRLNDAMTPVLQKLGLTMEVFSGGQPATGANRVGSVRHDRGNAADVFFNQNGMRLNWANPAHRPIFEQIISMSRGQGVTGFGVGPGYMAEGSMHIGFGSPAVWGAGGKGANAQAWAVNAFNNPISLGKTGSVAANQNVAPVVAAPSAPTAGLGTSSGSGGTFQKFAGAAGALASGFASGYQTQNPLMGAISGGLGALGTGDPLAIGLGIVGGLIGGIVGLKKAIDEARAELDKLRPEMETFFKVGAGEGVSSLAESLRQYTDQAREYAKIADKARDFETLDRLREAVVDFQETLKGDFRLGFEATLKSLTSGEGLSGELVQAQQSVLALREELKAFIADAKFTYGAGSGAAADARMAAGKQLMSLIDGGAEELSDVAFEMQRLESVLPSIRDAMADIANMGPRAEESIRERLKNAITALRDGFEEDLTSSINDLSGRGYLNEVAAAQERYNTRLSDAAALGLDASGAQEELALSLIAIQKNAGATAGELTAFAQATQMTGDALRGFYREQVEDAAATLRQTLDVWRDFVDGIAEYRKGLNLNPSLSTLSPADRLGAARAAFEATAAGAAAGDRDAMGRLQADASAYLEQAAGFWSSSEQYAAIFKQVQSTLLDVETKAASEVTIAEQALAYAEQNVVGLSAANDNLLTLVQSSEALRAAVDAYLGVGGSLPMSIADMAAAAIAAAQSSTALVTQSVSDMANAIADASAANYSGSRGGLSPERQAVVDARNTTVQLGVENKGFFDKVGDWFAGLFGWANGGAFINGMPVTAFATGGVVSSPTLFPMRNGMGLMGEAGPEAIMPLRRGSDGRLGVSAQAGNDNRAELRELARVMSDGLARIEAAVERSGGKTEGVRSEISTMNSRLRDVVDRPQRATGTR